MLLDRILEHKEKDLLLSSQCRYYELNGSLFAKFECSHWLCWRTLLLGKVHGQVIQGNRTIELKLALTRQRKKSSRSQTYTTESTHHSININHGEIQNPIVLCPILQLL